MDGGEYQVSGEGRLNRNLRGLRVADFADHDFVGIVTQNRSQSASERQSFFLIHRNLRDAAKLVFDRVFNRDDLIFVSLNLIDRGVKSSRFTATGRPCDQHHAVGLFDVAPEFAQIVFVETNHVERQRAELLAHRLFVEHTENRVFAVNRRHDRNAEVDGAPVVFHPEASVLGHAALGNVEFAHDLDARNYRGMVLFANGWHGLREHAVDTKLDDHRIIAGLDVNIRSAPLQRSEDGGIDEPDDRAGIARRCQLVDRQRLFGAGILVFANNLEAFAGLFQHSLRLLGFFENVRNLLQRRNFGDDALLQQQADFVDHHQLAGIGDGDGELAIGSLFQRHEVVPEHQLYRNFLEQLVM